MLRVVFPEQSNQADWLESIKLVSEDDGEPVWTTVPVDLVATLTVRPANRDGRDTSGATPVINVTTIDGSGQLTAFASGFLEISVPAASMSNIDAGFYEAFLKIYTNGVTGQALIGCINIIAGA